ncbi:unnamed protein product [Lymnaea stagnalis]|uniref:Four-jointed box protein 1 n=1 Tax=Lymnaea stagnalis TaxID=6523 RepID=A0AAV2IN20_LYMST
MQPLRDSLGGIMCYFKSSRNYLRRRLLPSIISLISLAVCGLLFLTVGHQNFRSHDNASDRVQTQVDRHRPNSGQEKSQSSADASDLIRRFYQNVSSPLARDQLPGAARGLNTGDKLNETRPPLSATTRWSPSGPESFSAPLIHPHGNLTGVGRTGSDGGNRVKPLQHLTGVSNHAAPRGTVDRSLVKSIADDLDQYVDGVYWTHEVDKLIPKGISEEEADQWIANSRKMKLDVVESSEGSRCSGFNNFFASMADGSNVCVRYRSPRNSLIQGEVLSYWLARLLALDCVPPVTISTINSSQWSTRDVMRWTWNDHLGVMMWIDEIDNSFHKRSNVFMPAPILNALRTGIPFDKSALLVYIEETLANVTSTVDVIGRSEGYDVRDGVTRALIALAQWGSMIIFDYLTGNHDRVVSMQEAAFKENNTNILQEPIRNLKRSKYAGTKLWLIDNERGFLDAYHLMYGQPKYGARFIKFHDQMLHTMCIFQGRFVRRLRKLNSFRSPPDELRKYALRKEPLLLAAETDAGFSFFNKHFSERLSAVVQWIQHCESTTTDG